jgi:hypothetical protein
MNPSGAMRCAAALYKPSSKQHGRSIFGEPARAEASSAECHTFPLLSVTLAFTGKWLADDSWSPHADEQPLGAAAPTTLRITHHCGGVVIRRP